jgi:hypothetical protein
MNGAKVVAHAWVEPDYTKCQLAATHTEVLVPETRRGRPSRDAPFLSIAETASAYLAVNGPAPSVLLAPNPLLRGRAWGRFLDGILATTAKGPVKAL